MKRFPFFLSLALLLSCVDSIPGHPESVVAAYVKAVQAGNHTTIFELTHLTARHLKFVRASDHEEDRKALAAQVEEWRVAYENTPAGYSTAQRWNEKNIFLSSATVLLEAPYEYKPVGDDPVNADYVKGSKVIVPVTITYAANEPFLYEGAKVRAARFDCILGKIRDIKNVRTYSQDDHWYITACLIDPLSVQETK